MDHIATLLVIGALAYFVLTLLVPLLSLEPRYRLRWRRRSLVTVSQAEPGGPLRGSASGRGYRYVVEHRGAPRLVKVVAAVSLMRGLLLLPLLLFTLVGLVDLMCYELALLLIPSLVLAAGLYANAWGLLRCDPAAAVRARQLREFTDMLATALLVVVVAVLMVFSWLWPLLAVLVVWAVSCMVHASGLGRVADAIDVAHAERAHVPRGGRAGPSDLSAPLSPPFEPRATPRPCRGPATTWSG